MICCCSNDTRRQVFITVAHCSVNAQAVGRQHRYDAAPHQAASALGVVDTQIRSNAIDISPMTFFILPLLSIIYDWVLGFFLLESGFNLQGWTLFPNCKKTPFRFTQRTLNYLISIKNPKFSFIEVECPVLSSFSDLMKGGAVNFTGHFCGIHKLSQFTPFSSILTYWRHRIYALHFYRLFSIDLFMFYYKINVINIIHGVSSFYIIVHSCNRIVKL